MSLLNSLLDPIERLINEHGSATVLREHLALIKTKQAELEGKCADLQAQNAALQAKNQQQQERLGELARQCAELQGGNASGHVCDHCGSPLLTRTGNKPDPTFGRLGVKRAVFTCRACSKTSDFQLPP